MNVEDRLLRVEKRLQRMRVLLVAVVIASICVCTLAASTQLTDLVCRSLVVKGPNGKTVIELTDDGTLTAPCVPLGMMLPYFGAKLPHGFVWADGKTNWPDEPWVADHLRGKPVPDMMNQLIGGAESAAEIGLVWDKGSINVPRKEIAGSAFKLPAQRSEEKISTDSQNFPRGPWVVVQRAGSTYDGKHGFFWTGFGSDFDTRVGTYQTFPPGAALDGSFQLNYDPIPLKSPSTNPRHVCASWIIRVQ